MFSGDEHYAGRSPSQGTELCAVVEEMFSLENLISILGDASLGDRLERIAYNALPATFSPDMWAHQYDQQANQVVCRVAEDRVYVSNGPDANIYGLEPNFGCCTANMHQGWPKFASHLWMRTGGADDGEGLAAIAYAPCEVNATLNGVAVRVTVDTEYPFGDTIELTVRCAQPGRFPLALRVPGWCSSAMVTTDGGSPAPMRQGAFHLLDHEWRRETHVGICLPMPVSAEKRNRDSVAISRGPLVFGLRIGEDWRPLRGEPPHRDWEVYPTTPWNMALVLDPVRPEADLTFTRRPLGACPFSPEGAPVVVRGRARRLPDWVLEHNAAAPPPASPVSTAEPVEAVELLPYGCTNLRITEFPWTPL
jgi:DUF1680 family protein